MPRKLILSFLTLFALGFGSASWISSAHEEQIKARNRQNLALLKIEKHLMPVTVRIQGPESFPSNDRDRVTLTGHIKLAFPDFKTLRYAWKLPDEVEIIRGAATGEIANPTSHQVYKIELEITGFSDLERKEISLLASTQDISGNNLGSAAVITSRPEDSLEQMAPQIMAKAQELKRARASQDDERVPASEDEP
jgi:hypothetical protein